MVNNYPKAKGNNQSLKKDRKLINDKSLERNVQIEVSSDFLEMNKTKNKE